MQTIITIEDTFLIKNQGLVVTGWQINESLQFKQGDLVEIEIPNSSPIQTIIDGVEHFPYQYCFGKSDKKNVGLLFKSLLIKDIPRGSIIKLIN